MMRHEPVVEAPLEIAVAAPEPRRDRVVVRRRRSKSRHRKPLWTTRASRRKVVRTFFICVGALMLMAVVVYFGLARSDALP